MLLLSLLLCARVGDSPFHAAQGRAFNVLSPHRAGVNRQWVCPRHPNLCLLRCAVFRRGGAVFHSAVPCLSHANPYGTTELQGSHCYKQLYHLRDSFSCIKVNDWPLVCTVMQ